MVRKLREDHRSQAALQGQLCLLPYTHHGRRKKHDPTLPNLNQFQEPRRTEELRRQVIQASDRIYET